MSSGYNIVLTVFLVGCGATPVEGELPECEGEHFVFSFVADGVPGVNSCIPMRGNTYFWGSSARDRPEVRVSFATTLHGPDHARVWDLPPPTCDILFVIDNLWPPETGASGTLEPYEFYVHGENRTRSRAMLAVLNDTTGERCPNGRGSEVAQVTGGTWHIVQGAREPGEWLTVEAYDVTVEPYPGHSIRFDRLRWHARLGEPWYPGP